eukprot:GHVU01129452.1.p1 GENE.GHVU01129452.1~~GHVU01129452.1.p1  ORF type:complete len:128 (-),score=3.46 GHVU01129452.1:1171-1554(-)
MQHRTHLYVLRPAPCPPLQLKAPPPCHASMYLEIVVQLRVASVIARSHLQAAQLQVAVHQDHGRLSCVFVSWASLFQELRHRGTVADINTHLMPAVSSKQPPGEHNISQDISAKHNVSMSQSNRTMR